MFLADRGGTRHTDEFPVVPATGDDLAHLGADPGARRGDKKQRKIREAHPHTGEKLLQRRSRHSQQRLGER